MYEINEDDFELILEVYISQNFISEFPKQFQMLTNIQKLDISNNLFADIPYQIFDLPNLKLLNVQ